MKIQISKTKIAVVAPRLVQCVNCGNEEAHGLRHLCDN